MRALLTPRWVMAHVVVVVLAIVFVNLGLWQLRRLDEVRLENMVGQSRFSAEPAPLSTLLQAAGDDTETLTYRRATVTGEYDPANEVLIRSQVYRGTAGFHVLTPLMARQDTPVLVNRGWVPLDADEVPVTRAPPPSGEVMVEGWIRQSAERAALGPADPAEGRLGILNRVDIDRIEQQTPYELAPVYLIARDVDEETLPWPVDPPELTDEGPHLGYAIQWFGFAAIGLIGYFFLIRRSVTGRGGPSRG